MGAVALLLGVGALWLVAQAQTERARADARVRAEIFATRLADSLYAAEHTARVLAGLRPQAIASQEVFEQVTRDLKDVSKEPLVMQWAPQAVVRYSYPLAGNERAIGLDLRADPRSRELVDAIIASGRALWQGPFPLVQGGLGMVYRVPVYRDGAAATQENFLGLATTLVNLSVSAQTLAKEFPAYTMRVTARAGTGKALEVWGEPSAGASEAAALAQARYVPRGEASAPEAGVLLEVAATPRAPAAGAAHWPALLGVALLALLAGWLAFAIESRRAGRAALVESEAENRKLALAVARTDNAVILTDAEGRIEWVNEGFTRISGYSAAEALGRKPGHFLQGPESDPETVRWMSAAIRAGEAFQAEIINHNKAGRSYWISIEAQPIHDDGGRLTGFMAIESDITERKAAEAELHKQYTFQRTLLNGAGAAIIATTVEGTITLFNPAAEALLGYRADETIGKLTPGVFHDPAEVVARAAELSAELGRTIEPGFEVFVLKSRSGELETGEWTYVRKDGVRVPVALNVSALRNDAGQITSFLGVARDISAHKAAEKQVRELSATRLALSEARLKRMVALSEAWYWETDSELRFTVMGNVGPEPEQTPMELERFRAMTLGRRRWEIAGIEAVSETWDEHRARIEARQTFLDFEYTIPVDNEKHWVRISGEPMLDADGRFAGYRGVGKDVTADRLTENRLQEMQKTELIGQLTGGLAHDFRNMLNVVLGNLDLLEEMLAMENKKHLGPLATARTAALNGVGVTESLLAVARRQPLQLQQYDLNELIKETEPLVRTAVGSVVRVEQSLFPGALPVKMDAAGLSNVVLNLAVNARDAMQEQAREQRIFLRTRREQVHTETVASSPGLGPGDYVVLDVSDTGPGMSPEVLQRAFDPFFTTKPPGKGTGLGLAMVHGFAQQLGGQATIGTALGEGTTISIYLPLQQGEVAHNDASEPAAPQSNDTPQKARRMLVVEDQTDLCELACVWLESMGHSVLGVHSAEEALRQIATGRFDVLFTDVMMPGGIDGITLAREALRRVSGLQVVFASGNTAGIPIEENGRPIQAIIKPYRKSDLLKVFGKTS